MADKKISALTSLAQGDVAVSTDVLPIVDTSATETKKVTAAALVGAGLTAGVTSVDINSGAIDGTTIGASSAAAGTFTNLTASGTVSFSGATVSNGGSVTTVDINGGTIDGATIATSDITVGSGKTLNVSAGTLTLADNQISGDKIEGGTINAITINTLTSTAVNATTVDATNVEVTNVKAKDGTASIAIADSTGVASLSANPILSGGTANGVLYLNGSKVATSGSALTFDGSALGVSSASNNQLTLNAVSGSTGTRITFSRNSTANTYFGDAWSITGANLDATALFTTGTNPLIFGIGTEQMRLTSTGLGIGTSSPGYKLEVASGSTDASALFNSTAANGSHIRLASSGTVKNYIGCAAGFITDGAADDLGLRAVGKISFATNGAGADMLLDTSGNLGIGTSSPSYKLDVNGAANFGANVYHRIGGTPVFATSGGFTYYYGNTNGIAWRNAADNTTQMTLDASGNLGVGTTNPGARLDVAASSPTVRIHGTNDSVGLNGVFGTLEWYTDDASTPTQVPAKIDVISGSAFGDRGEMRFFTNSSSALTERARITSAGDLLLNTTSTGGRLVIAQSNATQPAIYLPTDESTIQGSGTDTQIRMGGNLTLQSGNQTTIAAKNASGVIVFQTGSTPTERARITSGGDLLVGTTSNSGYGGHVILKNGSESNALAVTNSATSNPYGPIFDFTGAAPNDSTRYFLSCKDTSATRATIRSNGGLANYQSNNADLSDARTKKDIAPAASMWGKIGALEIVTYKYNDQTHDDVNVGVIAQQVESVEPVWVDADGFGETPEGEEPLKTVYTKDITFAAIKALQEAMARIEQLEAKVAVLESK